jgi:hypothetical protein
MRRLLYLSNWSCLLMADHMNHVTGREQTVRLIRPAVGEMIECIHPWDVEEKFVECEVVDLLDQQFTVEDCEQDTYFYFYKDIGVTWRHQNEPN